MEIAAGQKKNDSINTVRIKIGLEISEGLVPTESGIVQGGRLRWWPRSTELAFSGGGGGREDALAYPNIFPATVLRF